MNSYQQPDEELTDQQRLVAALVALDQRVPCGQQLSLPDRLDRSIASVQTLFAQHDLPLRDELVAELTVWRHHAEDGRRFAHQWDQLMRAVINTAARD